MVKEYVSFHLFHTSFLGDTAELFTSGISLLWIRKENMVAFSTYFDTDLDCENTPKRDYNKKGLHMHQNKVNHMRI